MSFKSESNNPVDVIGNIMLFVQLGDLHVRVHIGVVDKLAFPLLVGTSFIDRFVQGIFPMERRVVPVRSGPLAIISEYTPPADPLTALHAELDTENDIRTPIFRDDCMTVPDLKVIFNHPVACVCSLSRLFRHLKRDICKPALRLFFAACRENILKAWHRAKDSGEFSIDDHAGTNDVGKRNFFCTRRGQCWLWVLLEVQFERHERKIRASQGCFCLSRLVQPFRDTHHSNKRDRLWKNGMNHSRTILVFIICNKPLQAI